MGFDSADAGGLTVGGRSDRWDKKQQTGVLVLCWLTGGLTVTADGLTVKEISEL